MSTANLMLLFLCLTFPAAAQTISPGEAAGHIGEPETVCGTISGEHTASGSRGKPTFIDLDAPYPHQMFTVLIWGEDRHAVGDIPASGRICVSGTIRQYRGVPEIVLESRKNWYVPRRSN